MPHLYLMRSCGFSAREAMGWLRIMRPGSVIGEQQHYLCAVDAALQAARRRASGGGADSEHHVSAANPIRTGGPTGRPVSLTRLHSAPELAAQVSGGMVRRSCSSASMESSSTAYGLI